VQHREGTDTPGHTTETLGLVLSWWVSTDCIPWQAVPPGRVQFQHPTGWSFAVDGWTTFQCQTGLVIPGD
jgi:hypothetical protein